jgi:hypothetical protein
MAPGQQAQAVGHGRSLDYLPGKGRGPANPCSAPMWLRAAAKTWRVLRADEVF